MTVMSFRNRSRRLTRRSFSASRRTLPRIRWGLVVVALGAAVVLVAAFVAVQLLRSAPPAQATVVLPTTIAVKGAPPAFPSVNDVSTDVYAAGVGTLYSVNADAEVPLASVAKLVAALVVLHDHPLQQGEEGPEITVTSAIASQYPAQAADKDSVVKVKAGEQLTELEALEAMLVPSADNIAQLLAQWNSGSLSAFVSAMNSEVSALGLRHTHLADVSGLDPASVGSAADMIRLARAVMANPVLAQVVAMPQVSLPLAGTVFNYDYALGRDGIDGIKTGSTPQVGGNFVFSATRTVDGEKVDLYGAVLGERGAAPLPSALDAAEGLSSTAFASLSTVTLLPRGTEVLRVSAPWGDTAKGVATVGAKALVCSGEKVTTRVSLAGADANGRLRSLSRGERLAIVSVQLPNKTVSVPVDASGSIRGPSMSWKLGRL